MLELAYPICPLRLVSHAGHLSSSDVILGARPFGDFGALEEWDQNGRGTQCWALGPIRMGWMGNTALNKQHGIPGTIFLF